MLTAHERVACSMIDAAELAYSRKDKSLGLLFESFQQQCTWEGSEKGVEQIGHDTCARMQAG